VTRRLLAATLLVLVGGPVGAGEHDMAHPAGPARPMAGLGDHHHPIAAANLEAQRFFDQGLNLVFAFNHDEAVRSFTQAAALDPKAAMPQWGIALALGPNINLDVDPERERAAYEAVHKALALARHAPPHERAYVEALARRYANDPKADLKALAVDYKNAMGDLVRRYPDDLDAATLYAESAMDLHPWQLWQADGTPTEGTEEILAVLESVMKRDPLHPGANHYYVHAVEASPHPERALPSAARLETLVPGAGHLVHMPSHIYMRTGDYLRAARANEHAVETDRAYVGEGGHEMYALMYYTHDFHFMAAAYAMAGRGADAKRAAEAVVTTTHANAPPDVAQLGPAGVAMLDLFLFTPTFVALRFHEWADVLAAPAPDRTLPASQGLWHFARGVALAETRKTREARGEREALEAARRALPADAMFGFSRGVDVLELAAASLDARLAERAGDRAGALTHWQRAVAAQDRLSYDEPPDWYYPVRESLGGALLRADRAAEAEAVFRADLERNPRNPRSLFGLAESLAAQKKTADAAWVRAAFESGWREADTRLTLADL
jgi:tetratricopeptide (TPR) repeat protein